jgi:hypothetical protein
MAMAKTNYQFEKRQRDLAKKRKQEEKRLRKLATKTETDVSGADSEPARETAESTAVPPGNPPDV